MSWATLAESVERFGEDDPVPFHGAGPDRVASAGSLGEKQVFEVLPQFAPAELLQVRGGRGWIDLDDLVDQLGSGEFAKVFVCDCGWALSDHDISPGRFSAKLRGEKPSMLVIRLLRKALASRVCRWRNSASAARASEH